MYSQEQIEKAKDSRVRLIAQTTDRMSFSVSRISKSQKKTYFVNISTEKMPIFERFTREKSTGCDCWWSTNHTMHGDKLCHHMLAVVIWLEKNKQLPEGYFKRFVEGLE